MLVWVIIIFILATFSLLARILPDVFPLQAKGVVNFGIDLAIFLVALGILARINFLERKAEKEKLRERVEELEKNAH